MLHLSALGRNHHIDKLARIFVYLTLMIKTLAPPQACHQYGADHRCRPYPTVEIDCC